MKPSDVLHREFSGKGTIVVTGISTDTITVLGASVPVSVRLGAEVNMFSLVPIDGGMVALQVHTARYSSRKGYRETFSFFLAVNDEKGEGKDIDLEYLWGPDMDRLGQIEGDYLEARVDNDLFTTRPEEYWHNYPTNARRHYVPDANVVCRYLTGELDADALRAAATTHEEEMDARKRLPEVEKELAAVKQELASWRSSYTAVDGVAKDVCNELNTVRRKLGDLVIATDDLIVQAQKRLFKSRALRDAIREVEEKLMA